MLALSYSDVRRLAIKLRMFFTRPCLSIESAEQMKLVIHLLFISKAIFCKAICRTSNRFPHFTLSCLFSCHLHSYHISNLSFQLLLGLRFLNEHLPVPSEPLLHSLCNPSQHDCVDSWRWVGTMQDDSLDAHTGVVVQLQSDG